MIKDIMTVEEVAEVLRVNPQTVRKLIREKKLQAFNVGSNLRIRKEALEEYMRNASR